MADAPPPFTCLDSEVLVTNRWHRYRRDRYVQTDGSTGEYYYIDMAGACAVVPLFEDGSTVLVRVHRYLLGCELWEFPIGGMEPADEPLPVAQKELREEAGLLAEHWTELGRFAPYKGVSNEITHAFLARGLRWTERALEPSEGITVHQMPLDEARRRLLEQEIGDGQSLVTLMLLDRYLAR